MCMHVDYKLEYLHTTATLVDALEGLASKRVAPVLDCSCATLVGSRIICDVFIRDNGSSMFANC